MGLGRLFAHWTTSIKRRELTEAVPVNGMATGHFVARHSTREQVLLADWTIGHIFPRLAIVIVEQKTVNTHAAVFTVAEVLPAPDATESTLLAMVGVLVG